MPEILPARSWVNARIEVLIPLAVPVDSDDATKQEAVAEAMFSLGLPRNAAMRGEWVDCHMPEQEVPDIPPPPSSRKEPLK